MNDRIRERLPMKKVSVIIPNYNGKKYLKKCIASLKEQSYLNVEIIVIDNASTDSEYEWLRQDQSILFEQLNHNYGFSKAVNKGIKRANGEFVLLLNNDTVVTPDFVKELVKTMERNQRIFGVSSKMISYHEPEKIDDAGDEYTLLGWTLKRGDGEDIERYTKESKVFSSCAGAALYRRKIFNQIGYFDENFFAYMEDVDISYRARIYGYYNVFCPNAKVYHIGSATSGSRYNTFKVKLAARNNVYVAYKNMPLLQLVINSPFLIMGYLIKYLFFMKKGMGEAYKEGLMEGIRSLKDIHKVPFCYKNIFYYIHIEGLLIKNVFTFIGQSLRKVINR